MSTQSEPLGPSHSRTLVLCFDGTGNLFDDTNTNVVKLFSFLQKDNREEQLVYYQPGIGTYVSPGMMGSIRQSIAKVADEAFAWYLDAHVMGGYRFLMQNYQSEDSICLFGFSRGAYTARALAGMLHKVGLLPRDNTEQVGFAYNMYKATGKKNAKLAFGFKEAFSRHVKIEFMGCWDTVSSVGVFWGRHLPFTSSNTTIRCFRHALSLDEHRAKFQPNTWHRDAPDSASAKLDPEHGSHFHKNKQPNAGNGKGVPDENTDVLEVWFSGCHTDIGGGSTPSNAKLALSDITLRWMLREIVVSQCGILFDNDALARGGIPLCTLSPEATLMARSIDGAVMADTSFNSPLEKPMSLKDKTEVVISAVPPSGSDTSQLDALDAIQPLHDELKLDPIWWVLEVIPFFVSWQDETGKWHRAFRWNLGRGRTLQETTPNLHTTVQLRMADKDLAYTPKANWTNKPNANWVN